MDEVAAAVLTHLKDGQSFKPLFVKVVGGHISGIGGETSFTSPAFRRLGSKLT
jgi:hypothetical protein